MEGIIGFMTPFAGNFAPKSWAFCAGQIMSIASNTALFSILGTTYGGNGTTTFALPDLRSRVAIGAGNGPALPVYALGQASGHETVTLNVQQLPAHNHMVITNVQVPVNPNAATLDNPENAFPATGNLYAFSGDGSSMAAGAINITGTLNPAGNNQPINTISPVIGMPICICCYGVFPSRG